MDVGFRVLERMTIIFSRATKRRAALCYGVKPCMCVRVLPHPTKGFRSRKGEGNGVDHVDPWREAGTRVLKWTCKGRVAESLVDGEARFSADGRIPRRGHVPWKLLGRQSLRGYQTFGLIHRTPTTSRTIFHPP